MPLVRFEVRNEYGLGDPELYRGATKREDPKALLDGVAVAGLVGILRQLGDLAEFAADVFHDLHEQVMATTARGRKMLTQIQHIEAVLPSIEKVVQCQTSHVHFAYVAGSDWHANLQTEESHLLSSDLPQFIMDSYEECRDPPRLYMLDKFDIAGAGSCLRRYSDPSYFKRVWATSELARTEKGQRENKAQRYKRKGSRLRNGEVQQSISIAQQRSSSSTLFASPATDGQSMSSESTFISDMRLKSEVASTSVSFDPKIRLNNFDRVSDTKPSVVHDELESDNSSISNLLINHSNICAPIPQDGPIEDGVDNYTQHDILEGPSFNGSPSVTWDEKIEIVRPTSPKSCEDILVDIVQSSESPEVRCEPLDMNHEIANLGAEEEDILFDIENVPVPVSGGNHFDEVTSETDNYMDALNTMESETETDSECQTKREVKSLQNCTNQELDLGREKIHEVTGITASNVDSADVETPISSNVSLNRDASLKVSNLDHSEDLVFVHTPHSNGFSPIPDYTHAIDVSESSRDDIPRMDSIEDRNGSLTLELSKLGVKTPANTSELQDLPAKISSTPGAMIWTNGGLLGLEPSKPPDFSAPDTAIETISSGGSPAISDTRTLGNESILRESCSVEKMNGSNSIYNFAGESSLRSDEPTEGIYDLLQHDALEYSLIGHDNQYDSMTVKQNFQEPLQALQLNEPERCQTATSNGIYADIDLPDLTEPKATASGVELANNESRSSESVQTSLSISSSLSGLAQRFLANSLQRKASLTNVDITLKSEMVNIGMRKSQQTSLPNKHQQMSIGAASQAPHEPRNRERAERGSCRSSISSSSHCSGQSSPPLEHMKISFHPLNGSETSKLKLDFSNANVHESIEDLMFPSFQLLPASTVPLAEIGFESDDDTFCQFCPYSSEELLSPRSDSNSEFWEQDERSTNINNGIYDDSQRISSSSASVSSFIGFEEMNHHRIDPASGLKNAEIGNSIMCLQSGPVADLPSLDSVKYSKNEQEREGDSSPINSIDTALQSVNDLPPSRPPPLPPIQWRMMKSSFLLGEEMNSIIAEKVDHFGGLQDQGFTVNHKQEHGVPTQPPVTRAISLPSKTAHGKEKLNGEEEMKHRVQDKEPVEREEFLQQIRNKTFNLRRTVTAKPSFTPQSSTNVNVAAILEKANAIRQAFVGSDEGGDDDNWSDG